METGSDSGGRRRANTGTKQGKESVRLSRGGSRGPTNPDGEDSGDRRLNSRPSRQAAQVRVKSTSFLFEKLQRQKSIFNLWRSKY